MSTRHAPATVARRALHGVLLLDKPVGPSSNAVLGRARRLWRAEKAGHTGTLDPLASGLMVVCFGAATKFAQVGLDADKRYLATLHLGVTREGGDLEGRALRERPVGCDRAEVDAAAASFVGAIDQLPPMHSALKHQGRPLYELARQGIEVERTPRRVCVHAIDVVSFDAPALVLDVRCSKGTYIRTLAEDIGEALGCGAHLAGLRRTATGPVSGARPPEATDSPLGGQRAKRAWGPFEIDAAITLDDAERLDEPERDARLLPPDALIAHWPRIDLDAGDAARFLTGLRRRVRHADAAQLRVYGPRPDGNAAARTGQAFLGAAHVRADELIPDRLLSPDEIRGSLRMAPEPIDAVRV
jgi:tRNA pseudouridine55 synthase